MADNVRKLSELKVKVERLRANTERAKGALDVATAELQDKWQCIDLAAAHVKLAELECKEELLRTKYERQFDEFEKSHGELLARANTA